MSRECISPGCGFSKVAREQGLKALFTASKYASKYDQSVKVEKVKSKGKCDEYGISCNVEGCQSSTRIEVPRLLII